MCVCVCVYMSALRVCVCTYYFSFEHRLNADMYSVASSCILSLSGRATSDNGSWQAGENSIVLEPDLEDQYDILPPGVPPPFSGQYTNKYTYIPQIHAK